jgi:hypothetical protein
MYVYRVTRTRKNPRFFQSAVSTKICTERSLKAQIKAIQQVCEHYRTYKDRYNLTEPAEKIVKIERALVEEFEDVTKEFSAEYLDEIT